MWIIWGCDRHHHALTAHGRARKRWRWSGIRLPAQSSSGATTCRLGSSTRLSTQGSSGWRHVSPRLRLPPPDSGQFWERHVFPQLQLSPPAIIVGLIRRNIELNGHCEAFTLGSARVSLGVRMVQKLRCLPIHRNFISKYLSPDPTSTRERTRTH
jgi:hypothetical protein